MFKTLKSLFVSNKVNVESFSDIGVDIHSHLIANIDDGVKTIDEAIEIILKMKSLGFKKIITTPHTMRGGYDNTPKIILSGFSDLKNELIKRKIDFNIEVASEYYMDETFVKLIRNNENILTFGDKYLLFEFSYLSKHNNMESVFFDMNLAGYKPVLAHPERYPYLYSKSLAKYEKIKDAGILLQLNMFSLVGYYGKSVQKIAEQLIDAGMIDFVGSDIHNTIQLEVLESCLKSEYLDKLIKSNSLKNKFLH